MNQQLVKRKKMRLFSSFFSQLQNEKHFFSLKSQKEKNASSLMELWSNSYNESKIFMYANKKGQLHSLPKLECPQIPVIFSFLHKDFCKLRKFPFKRFIKTFHQHVSKQKVSVTDSGNLKVDPAVVSRHF